MFGSGSDSGLDLGSGHLRVPCSGQYGFGSGGIEVRLVSDCLYLPGSDWV